MPRKQLGQDIVERFRKLGELKRIGTDGIGEWKLEKNGYDFNFY